MTDHDLWMRHDGDFFDRFGDPITMGQWSDLQSRGLEYTRVAFDELNEQDVTVSTIWLGYNHNWDPEGEPLIFETAVFGDVDLGNNNTWRWCSIEQARVEHAKIVEALSVNAPDSL